MTMISILTMTNIQFCVQLEKRMILQGKQKIGLVVLNFVPGN